MKTNNKKAMMYERIEKHGKDLNVIFNTGIEPIELCKKLFRLENKAHNLCIEECNTGIDNDSKLDVILTQVKKILFANVKNDLLEKAIFINGDPRGYTLKINSDYVLNNNLSIHQDWGNYGIIAPDFN